MRSNPASASDPKNIAHWCLLLTIAPLVMTANDVMLLIFFYYDLILRNYFSFQLLFRHVITCFLLLYMFRRIARFLELRFLRNVSISS